MLIASGKAPVVVKCGWLSNANEGYVIVSGRLRKGVT